MLPLNLLETVVTKFVSTADSYNAPCARSHWIESKATRLHPNLPVKRLQLKEKHLSMFNMSSSQTKADIKIKDYSNVTGQVISEIFRLDMKYLLKM